MPRPSFWWKGEGGSGQGGSFKSAEIPRPVLISRNYKVRNRSTDDIVRFDYVIDEHSYCQEYIIEGRESILLHYSTVYHPFTEVSDLSSVLWFHGLHGSSACVSLVALAAVLCTAT